MVPTTAAQAAPSATISGTLVASSGVSVVSGITVWAQPTDGSNPDMWYATTAANGAFSITGLPAGEYQLKAEDTRSAPENSGVTAQWYGGVPNNVHGQPITLADGQGQTLPNWRVQRGSTLHGSFDSVCETPSATIKVQLENSPQYPPYPFQAAETAYPIEASSTEYTIKGVLPGNWRVRVTVSGQATCMGYTGPIYLNPGDRELGELGLRRLGVGIDLNGDTNSDQIVRDGNGSLLLYPGDGSGGWETRSTIGTGWNSMNVLLNITGFGAEAEPDLLGRDDSGNLWLFRGNTNGTVSQYGQQVGTGWEGMTAIFSPGDFDGDGYPDVLARNSVGTFVLYPGNGHGGWGTPSVVGQGWDMFDNIFAGDDFNGDGNADVLARTPDGRLFGYYGDGQGGWQSAAGELVGTGWDIFTALVNAGDFQGDASPDVLARTADGTLLMYRSNGQGGWLASTGQAVGWGWGGMRFLD